MRWLADGVVTRLRSRGGEPDLSGTKYRLISMLGRGGMASVWLVEDRDLRREVALKVSDATAEARFRREAEVLAALEHPSIVPVHDVGELPDGRVYCAMKLVRGKRLDEWLAEAPPRPAALRLFQRVCEAVAFAHARSVIHRDIKPQNVMVGAFGEALVMDWGLAKRMRFGEASSADVEAQEADVEADAALADTVHAADASETAAGTVMGTPSYMAPEQARGEVDALDERTDVWALGVLLYFVLAGREPFSASSAREVLRLVQDAEPTPLDDITPRIAPPLRSIAARALRKAPSERYASAQEMAADVGRFLDGAAVEAHRETVLEATARIAKKYQVLLILVAAYLLMRAIVMVTFTR